MKKWATTALMTGQLLVSSFAFAHGPTPQRIDEQMQINAPIAAVWDKISNFGAINEWHPLVESATVPEEGMRVLKLKGKDGTITDSLDEKDESRHYINYRLYAENIEVIPVSYYGVAIQLDEADGGTQITWEGRFYRADTGNFPPAQYSDEAAVEAMKEFAVTGMEALKAELEGK